MIWLYYPVMKQHNAPDGFQGDAKGFNCGWSLHQRIYKPISGQIPKQKIRMLIAAYAGNVNENKIKCLVTFTSCGLGSRIAYVVKGEIPLCGTVLPPLTKSPSDSGILINSWLETISCLLFITMDNVDINLDRTLKGKMQNTMLSSQHTKWSKCLNS